MLERKVMSFLILRDSPPRGGIKLQSCFKSFSCSFNFIFFFSFSLIFAIIVASYVFIRVKLI